MPSSPGVVFGSGKAIFTIESTQETRVALVMVHCYCDV
ncbi:hypothetical protein E3A20_23410, partial [Planctomyces bekefii]